MILKNGVIAIALMVIPIEPVLYIVNYCLEDITEIEFQSICYQIFERTAFCTDLAKNPVYYLEQSDAAVGIISRYLHGTQQAKVEKLEISKV